MLALLHTLAAIFDGGPVINPQSRGHGMLSWSVHPTVTNPLIEILNSHYLAVVLPGTAFHIPLNLTTTTDF